MNPMRRTLLALLVCAGALLLDGTPAFGGDPKPKPKPPGGGNTGTTHVHNWNTEQVKDRWVPPVFENRIVGYDAKGKPIIERVQVKEGYWKMKKIKRCTSCGKVQGG